MRTEHSPPRGPRRSTIFAALTGLGWLAALAGCPGTLKDKERFLDGGPCPDVPAAILAAKCGGSSCHGATKPQQGLDLESPGVAARVVGHPAQECTGILADPGAPEASVLYTKLLDTPPCGGRMPLGPDKLSDQEVGCVKQWIAEQTAAPTGGGGMGGAGGGGGNGGAGGKDGG